MASILSASESAGELVLVLGGFTEAGGTLVASLERLADGEPMLIATKNIKQISL